MNYDLDTEQKAALLEAVNCLREATPAKMGDLGIAINPDAVFEYLEEHDLILCDAGAYVAYVCWNVPFDTMIRSGRMAAFAEWHQRTGLDGGFYETLCDMEQVWDADIPVGMITPQDIADNLELFLLALPGPFNWKKLIDDFKSDDDVEEDEEDGN